ncbi:MAG: thioesterase [Flavobacteriales bacterium]|nr:thioesterase [Flavobacteriales bacterium]|tara:strand:- start:254 stop:652 length:399 start_codon:yes stop_codon:yes gene_type:complete
MAFISGIRVKKLSKKQSEVTVPYKYINKNPFNSMYFAVEAMAAELSTGALVLLQSEGQNISTLVLKLDASYYKKATTKIKFICQDGSKVEKAINETLKTGLGTTCILNSKGFDLSNNCVAEFNITWSLKKRS